MFAPVTLQGLLIPVRLQSAADRESPGVDPRPCPEAIGGVRPVSPTPEDGGERPRGSPET